ncbi:MULTISPECIES: hypothetical protein [unclassified Nocardia]|uniref:hypothetical protein n=1 Tax=unclassified Nocardia TaxID=2637762 RepID=UPI00278BF00D|nr:MULTISPECIES: hypothetical protein [unclassified Nocardia]
MTSSEQPRRRKSLLSEDEGWEVSAKPPTTVTKPAPTPTPEPPPSGESSSRADARPRVGRGHARDREEARGRKRSRDAAYAWAAAAAKARDRQAELRAELDAALGRGTEPGMLADYVREACSRYDIPVHLLSGEIRIPIDLTLD